MYINLQLLTSLTLLWVNVYYIWNTNLHALEVSHTIYNHRWQQYNSFSASMYNQHLAVLQMLVLPDLEVKWQNCSLTARKINPVKCSIWVEIMQYLMINRHVSWLHILINVVPSNYKTAREECRPGILSLRCLPGTGTMEMLQDELWCHSTAVACSISSASTSRSCHEL